METKHQLEITVDAEVIEHTITCGLDYEARDVSTHCAFAYALRKVFPEASVVSAGVLYLEKSKESTRMSTSSDMAVFISEFDQAGLYWDNPGDVEWIRRGLLRRFGNGHKAVFTLVIPDAIAQELFTEEVAQLIKDSKHLKLKEPCHTH